MYKSLVFNLTKLQKIMSKNKGGLASMNMFTKHWMLREVAHCKEGCSI